MTSLTEQVRKDAEAHALAEFPREACGVVVLRKGRALYWPLPNINAQGADLFQADPGALALVEDAGRILAWVHSHPAGPPDPSTADLAGCERTGVPWHIVSVPALQWRSFEPSGFQAPLEGRAFVHGVHDCYALLRDWYAQETGVALPDFYREDQWWNKGQNLYLEGYESAGFERLADDPGALEWGDIILMHVGSTVPNHGAVYLGNNLIIHHLQNRLSCVEPFLGAYRAAACHFLRRKERPWLKESAR